MITNKFRNKNICYKSNESYPIDNLLKIYLPKLVLILFK